MFEVPDALHRERDARLAAERCPHSALLAAPVAALQGAVEDPDLVGADPRQPLPLAAAEGFEHDRARGAGRGATPVFEPARMLLAVRLLGEGDEGEAEADQHFLRLIGGEAGAAEVEAGLD